MPAVNAAGMSRRKGCRKRDAHRAPLGPAIKAPHHHVGVHERRAIGQPGGWSHARRKPRIGERPEQFVLALFRHDQDRAVKRAVLVQIEDRERSAPRRIAL